MRRRARRLRRKLRHERSVCGRSSTTCSTNLASSLNATGPNDAEDMESWRTICSLEAEELKGESYGLELLHAIGFA